MDIEEHQSTPMDIEEAASRLLRTDESGSMPVKIPPGSISKKISPHRWTLEKVHPGC